MMSARMEIAIDFPDPANLLLVSMAEACHRIKTKHPYRALASLVVVVLRMLSAYCQTALNSPVVGFRDVPARLT